MREPKGKREKITRALAWTVERRLRHETNAQSMLNNVLAQT